MSATTTETLNAVNEPTQMQTKSKSHWAQAFETLIQDKVALVSMAIISIYFVVAVLTSLDFLAADWNQEIGPSYAPPSAEYFLGLDIFGQSVLLKTIKSAEVALSFGFLASLVAVVIGLFMGLALVPAQAADNDKRVRMATTTSTENSGLLRQLLPTFQKASGYQVQVIAVGTGKALRMGREGDVDVVLVHAPAAEKKFVDGAEKGAVGATVVREVSFGVLEVLATSYLVTTNTERPESGSIWEKSHQTRTAQQTLEQMNAYLINLSTK